ncbi:uncharacterized protein LOC114309872 isoform X2 [Camellia sinensis]|uniref:uncharacterized protein LOC114309872 isoform X2 n=2 Tax=Camellia sinensis TaxID=4442 RepID=UPI001036D994|nr:uncharacterized protein LOC114309872 isoform X2 [Camellia sinensis]
MIFVSPILKTLIRTSDWLPSCDVMWLPSVITFIGLMLLVGPSLGAAVAIDFAVNHSEISIPLRLYATFLAFNGLPFGTYLDWINVGHLHCLLPWWEDVTVTFMNSGGYNVCSQIKHCYFTVQLEPHPAKSRPG